ncbi:inositol oxygenase-like isoform X2 [Centruroides sculpturatus]|uniref:inositol oxygenase-like isoform X2 n=1 Tax=Centruroides sculpturatus TaxID=218467 RepID=UPI000C6CC3FF|nr:inositol oxygenase-like isoform X2 [Centruroides sculpturatus]
MPHINNTLLCNSVLMLDPSEHYRPEHKKMEEFRQYTTDKDDHIQRRVRETYRKMHNNQTVQFVGERTRYWTKFDKCQMNIMQALEKLNALVDESDPDVDIPNIVHAFQTAERIRQAHPQLEWFHLTGLIHDLGKLMALYGEPQWAVVGDTFPVGCAPANSIVYRSSTFEDNPDTKDARYNTKFGIYEEHCGLENVLMSWGHDEYMYRVLKNHGTSLPEEALYVIRFHSFYPWHTGKDYEYLCNNKDMSMLKWIREFNKFDLYSKSHEVPDIESLIPYYQSLIDKYIPGKVKW